MASSKNKSKQEIANDVSTNESKIEKSASEVNEDMAEDDDDEHGASKILAEPPIKLMQTLPETFNSLVKRPINLTDKSPRNIIAVLGNAIGVDDYETNMASFWFLDFIALQVLRHENVLDEHDKSVMVSWLAGEMQLIRENNLSHEAFWRQMKDIFVKSSMKISRGKPPLHWDSMMNEGNAEEVIAEEESMEKSKALEKSESQEQKHRESLKSRSKRISAKDRSRHSVKSLEKMKIYNSGNISSVKDNVAPEVRSTNILDIIMEATDDMYGDSFHFALIVAAFIDSVKLHDYNFPFNFRVPRPLKMFNVEKITRGQNSAPSRKSKDTKKRTDDKKTRKSRDTKTIEIIEQPETSVVMTEEEMLIKKRQYILPLMESNEAANILEAYK